SLIRRLRGKHTILLSTHILSEIEQTCDRILMLNQGAIAAQGTEGDLLQRFAERAALELEVRPPEGTASPEALCTSLRALEGVAEVSWSAADGSPTFQLVVQAEADVREAVARATITDNYGLLGLRRRTTGLEKVFLELNRSESQTPEPATATAGEVSP
ncbi:MAG: ABC transporter ATP-binding protein, partial [Myxococcales bacterium]|nr:ABC transporter ATP-binding protein [Myxococcales bacterium]